MRAYCTGESLVANKLPEAEYKQPLTEDEALSLIQITCQVLDVPQPSVEFSNNGTKYRWGTYYFDRQLIRYNRTFKGIVCHELAHHIAYCKEGYRCKHNEDFAYWLGRVLDMWRN